MNTKTKTTLYSSISAVAIVGGSMFYLLNPLDQPILDPAETAIRVTDNPSTIAKPIQPTIPIDIPDNRPPVVTYSPSPRRLVAESETKSLTRSMLVTAAIPCVMPSGSDYNRSIEETGIVRSFGNCYLVVEVDGVKRTLFSGRLDEGNNTTPAIGQTIKVRYDPVTAQLFTARFPSFPFVVSTPPPPTFTSIVGWVRPNARMKLNMNFEPTQATTADTNGRFRFDNVQVGKHVTIQPEMAQVLFEPSIWYENTKSSGLAVVNFSSHTFPYVYPHKGIARIVIPQLTDPVSIGEVLPLKTQAFDAQNNQINPTPTLMYTHALQDSGKVYVNWDSHLMVGSAAGIATIQARTCTGFAATDPCPTSSIYSNSITINVLPVATPMSAPHEFARFPIPTIVNPTDPVETRSLLNSKGQIGYDQCYVFVGTKFFYCSRPINWTVKHEWKDWRWVSGQIERDALTADVVKQGYRNIFIWYGSLWASRPKS